MSVTMSVLSSRPRGGIARRGRVRADTGRRKEEIYQTLRERIVFAELRSLARGTLKGCGKRVKAVYPSVRPRTEPGVDAPGKGDTAHGEENH